MKAPYETLETLIEINKALMEIRDNLNDSNRKGWMSHRVEEATASLDSLIEEVEWQSNRIEVTPEQQ